MKVFGSAWPLAASLLLSGLAHSAIAEDAPCTCPDMLDLASRNNQVKAAIQAYEQQLSAWTAAGAAPSADESARIDLQEDIIEPPMAAAKDHRANTASAKALPDCTTTFDAPTSCLRVLMEQHEQVHRDACRAHVAEHSAVSEAIGERWQTLADYAREEIEAYKAERIYIEAALSNLERDCRYTLEFDSVISGATEATRSEAKTKVDLEVHILRQAGRSAQPNAVVSSRRDVSAETNNLWMACSPSSNRCYRTATPSIRRLSKRPGAQCDITPT